MRTHTLSLLIALALGGCTRTIPAAFPTTSAASTGAAEAPIAVVGRALREEPPLPGEPSEGWEALEQSSPPGGRHYAH